MSSNHPNRRARESVLELLFAYQFSDYSPDVVFDEYLKKNPHCVENSDFAKTLFYCVIKNNNMADKLIKSNLQNWEFNRVARLDRLLLRMGICEIFFIEEIPPKVSISEMIEISKIYSTDESPNFINGVLDAVYQEYMTRQSS